MKKTEFTISGITVCMNTPWEEKISENFVPFLGSGGNVEYEAIFCERTELKKATSLPVFQNTGYAVYRDEEGNYLRYFHSLPSMREPYAMTRVDFLNKKVYVDYLLGKEWCFGSQQKDFYYLGWENLLLQENQLIFHAACVNTSMGGILFSGPSGIGKSTQADLWCRFANGRLLNGDRPILAKREDGWNAYGSPYAGSSECYVNEKKRIKAIVLLKQAETCSIQKKNTLEAFREIYAQMTVNNWDKKAVSKVSNLVMDLITEIPVYELACTPDIEAVKMLQNTLEQEEDSWI